MIVDRSEEQSGPAVCVVYFDKASGLAGEKVDAGRQGERGGKEEVGREAKDGERPGERSRKINMKHKEEGEILDEVMRVCEGRQVVATKAEEEQLRELEEERVRGEEDRVRQVKVVRDRRRQQQILRQAKASMDV